MFVKGISGNPNGRPSGAVNLATKEIREVVTAIVKNNILQLQTDIEAMGPLTRAKVLLALMEFVLPKVQKVQVESADEKQVIIQEIRTYEKPTWFDEEDPKTGIEIKEL